MKLASFPWIGFLSVANPHLFLFQPISYVAFSSIEKVACPSVLARRVEDVAEAFAKPSCSAFLKVALDINPKLNLSAPGFRSCLRLIAKQMDIAPA